MTDLGKPIREMQLADKSELMEVISSLTEPVVFRGLVLNWPIVEKSLSSNSETDEYLRSFYADAPIQAFVGEREIENRFFYKDDLSELNFKQETTKLDWVLDQIQKHANDVSSPTFYMGSTTMDYCLPGLSKENNLQLNDIDPLIRIWIGNQTTVAAHYDVPDNLACVCAGKRRFTLFSPDQLENLYVGPLDFTPAGQTISMVDLTKPDLGKYPKFSQALEHALVAELGPGDAIYIPSMWWHHVQSLSDLNILINHWWRQSPAYMGLPNDALMLALMSIRDLPVDQRAAWKDIFEHYVFSPNDEVTAHIPLEKRGALGEMNEDVARKIRALLRNNLNR